MAAWRRRGLASGPAPSARASSPAAASAWWARPGRAGLAAGRPAAPVPPPVAAPPRVPVNACRYINVHASTASQQKCPYMYTSMSSESNGLPFKHGIVTDSMHVPAVSVPV